LKLLKYFQIIYIKIIKMVLPLISSSPSSSSRSTRMRNLKNSISTLGVNHFNLGSSGISSKAYKNGNGIVYHRSSCSYPLVRAYGNGGDYRGTSCNNWIDNYFEAAKEHARMGDFKHLSNYMRYRDMPNIFDIFPNCNQGLSIQDIIWFGVLNDPVATSKNKIAGIPSYDWNWSIDNIQDMKTIAETTNNGVNKYICSDAGIDLNPNYKE
jgi:hypothetical protein